MTTILIIDDDPTNLSFLLNHLRQAQFKVLVAENGEIGLERANYVKPDLILLDVMMPGLNGFETCRLLKLNPATQPIPVIFITSMSDTSDVMRGFEVGGVDYIAKPLQIQETLARVTTHLTLYRLQHKLEETVEARTVELQTEITRRQKSEVEKDELLQIIRSQNEQLYQVSTLLVSQQQEQGTISRNLEQQVEIMLTSLDNMLTTLVNNLESSLSSKSALLELKNGLNLLSQTRQVLHRLSANLSETQVSALSTDPRIILTPRELEVLHFVVKGLANNDIAAKLYLSIGSVSTYRTRLMRKLGAENMADLVKLALKYNLLPPE